MREENGDAFIGDLHEEYRDRLRRFGSARARLWYAKERFLMIVHSMWRWFAFAATIGVVAGSGAYAMSKLPGLRGPVPLICYAAVVLLLIYLFRTIGGGTFLMRFSIALTAFMVTTIVHILAMRLFDGLHPLSLWGHAWRLGFMLAIGAVLSLGVAVVTEKVGMFNPYLAVGSIGILGGGGLIFVVWTSGFTLVGPTVGVLVLATELFLRMRGVRSISRRLLCDLGVVAMAWTFVCFLFVAGERREDRRTPWIVQTVTFGAIALMSFAGAAASKPRESRPLAE